jgi:hypothetical protein
LHVLPDGRVDPRFPLPVASADGSFVYREYRPIVRAGRLPRPDRADEAFATPVAVRQLHVRVGSRLTLRDMSGLFKHNGAAPTRLTPQTGRATTFRIVGVGVFADDVAAASARSEGGGGAFATIYLTPAYASSHGGVRGAVYNGALLRLRPGSDLGRLRREIDATAARHPELPSSYDLASEAGRADEIQGAIRPEVVSLLLFAALVGLGSLLVVGQALARRTWAVAAEFPALRALGATRAQLVAGATLPQVGAAVVGAVLAVVGAVLASPLTPVGPARVAEPHLGRSADVTMLAVGMVVIVAALAGRAGVAAWRFAIAGETDTSRPSRVADTAARLGLPAPATAGLRLALEPGRGRNFVPVRSTMAGVALAMAAVVVVVTFDASLGRLETTPSRYGWRWDLAVDGGYVPMPADRVAGILGDNPGVDAVAGGNYGSVIVGGRLVPAVGLRSRRGSVFPTLLSGRALQRSDEAVVGETTLRRAGGRVGGTLDLQFGETVRRVRVVGQAVLPDFERGGFTATDLGEGIVLSTDLVGPSRLPPGSTYNFFLVRYRKGADPAAVRTSIERALAPVGCVPPNCNFFVDRRPKEVNAYRRIRGTPLLLAAVLALLATASLAHALVCSVRRRRRDLAVLKTLGFARRQVSAAVAWQATCFAVVTLAIGIPVGLAAGRWSWSVFAGQLGVGRDAAIPPLPIVVCLPLTLLLANVVAGVPAWSAGRVRPAAVLRTE